MNEEKNLEELNSEDPQENTSEETQQEEVQVKQAEDKTTGKMVQIDEGILTQLMNDVQDLKTGKRQVKPQRVTRHTATVKVIEDKYPVIEITKTWVENKGKPDETLWCQVAYLQGDEIKTKTYPYLDFLNNVVGYQVEIQEQKAEVKEKYLGMLRKTNPDPIKMGDTGKAFTPGETENIVRSVEYVSRVKFTEGTPLEGQEITISNNFLNI